MKNARTLETLTHTHTRVILIVIDTNYSIVFSVIENIEVVNNFVIYDFFLRAKITLNLGYRANIEKYIFNVSFSRI